MTAAGTSGKQIRPVAAIILAAGSGGRKAGQAPSQYRLLAGTPVLTRTLELLLDHPSVDHVVPVIAAGDEALYAVATSSLARHAKLSNPIIGGSSRQASILAGIEGCRALSPAAVLIHDAIRPLAGRRLFDDVLARLADKTGAVAAMPVDGILKQADGGYVGAGADNDRLLSLQTPEAFRFDVLLAAHRRAASLPRTPATDTFALLALEGHRVETVSGETDNLAIRADEDFARAERIVAAGSRLETRVGIGYDVHAFTEGDSVMLGGVRIPHDRGVLAHSDGDVALHAATDALLGAICDGDIGTHFPPSDPAWRGASSDRFLAFAAERVRARGGMIANLDITIVAEAPRVGPHRAAMREAIARAAGIAPERVSIKATTSEKLGFTGRKEGLAALAIASVSLRG